MPVLFTELATGVTGYPSAPQINASGAFQPDFHIYRGATNTDFLLSYDGSHDHFRLPAGAVNIIIPIVYKAIWLKTPNGTTGAASIGLHTT